MYYLLELLLHFHMIFVFSGSSHDYRVTNPSRRRRHMLCQNGALKFVIRDFENNRSPSDVTKFLSLLIAYSFVSPATVKSHNKLRLYSHTSKSK